MRRFSRRELLSFIAATGIAESVAGSFRHALAAAPASAQNMKITSYEIFPTSVPMRENVREAWLAAWKLQNRDQPEYEVNLIKLKSDEGLVGVCDAMMPRARAEQVAKSLIGHSPWEYLLDDSIGGLLVAVYDLLGQASGLPVSRLFSPRPQEKIIQTWWSQCFPPALMASEAKRGYDLGYRVHKVKARPWEDPIAQAAAIADAVPPDMRVWVDANAWWRSVGRTLHFVEGLSQFPHYFAIESPLKREHIDGYRMLKGKSALQVSEHMPADPMPFVNERLLVSFVIGRPIGKTLVQRALMAEVTKIPLWVEHSIESGVNKVFQAHQAAAFPGIEYSISIDHVLADDLMVEEYKMVDGYYSPTKGPGLGATIDMDAADRYRV